MTREWEEEFEAARKQTLVGRCEELARCWGELIDAINECWPFPPVIRWLNRHGLTLRTDRRER